MATIWTNAALVEYECWLCGIPFAISSGTEHACKHKGKGFYCPNGCHLGFGESEAQKLEKQLAQEKARHDQTQAALREVRAVATHHERSAIAYRGKLTSVKKRVANGVCPCCKRSFKDLAQHMKGQHPEYGKTEEATD